jgi:hypothetical protein
MLAEMHRSAVEEARGSYARPCAECGTPMTMGTGPDRAFGEAIEIFTGVAVDGTTYGPAVDLANLFEPSANWLGADNPYAYLSKLGDLCMSATSARRTETTWLYERTIREYTSLKVRLDMGSIYHTHRVASRPWSFDPKRPVIGERACVYHCTMPAMLRPAGWFCRDCGDLLTDSTAEIRMVPVYVGEALPPKVALRREACGYGSWPARPELFGRPRNMCEGCDVREAVRRVPELRNDLMCEWCIEQATLAGLLPA